MNRVPDDDEDLRAVRDVRDTIARIVRDGDPKPRARRPYTRRLPDHVVEVEVDLSGWDR